MATVIKVILRTDQANKEGKHQVRIRITKHRLVRYYNTGIFLRYDPDKRKSEWNEDTTDKKANWITSRHPDSSTLNNRLKAILKRFEELDTLYPTYTSEQLRDKYDEPETVAEKRGFIAFAEELIRRKEVRGQFQTATNNATNLNVFRRYWKNKPDNPDLITPALVSDLIKALRSGKLRAKGEKPFANSSINNYLSYFGTVFQKAIIEGWISPRENPFNLPEMGTDGKNITRPTPDLIYKLMHLEGLNQAQTDVRNLFLMQFFLHGARVSEAYSLKWSDIGKEHVTYWPKKKAQKAKYVKRHEGIEWVLQQYPQDRKYVFPFFTEQDEKLQGYDFVKRTKTINAKVAKNLIIIATKADLPHLSSHMQRHTLADMVWEETQNPRAVQEALGHNAFTTTEKYMSRMGQHAMDVLSTKIYTLPVEGNNRETNPENQ